MGGKKPSIKFQVVGIRLSAICGLVKFFPVIDGDFFPFVDVASRI